MLPCHPEFMFGIEAWINIEPPVRLVTQIRQGGWR
jgi:hypothetical protein